MRVAIIENMAGTPHGQIGIALEEAAADVHVIRAYAGEPLPADASDHDALVVLGGEQNALDDALYPYLPDLALLMKRFGDAGKAVMGVCLGSQLLARAYGGDNILSGPPEFGWEDVSLTEEGASDPLSPCDKRRDPEPGLSYWSRGLWHAVSFRGFHHGGRRLVPDLPCFR